MELQQYQLSFGTFHAPLSRIDRNEDGSPCYETFAGPDVDLDEYEVVQLTERELALMRAEDEAEDEAECAEALARCEVRYHLVMDFTGTVSQLCAAMRTHDLICPRCSRPSTIGAQSERGRTIERKEVA